MGVRQSGSVVLAVSAIVPLVAGCGGSTKTVTQTVASAPTAASPAAATTTFAPTTTRPASPAKPKPKPKPKPPESPGITKVTSSLGTVYYVTSLGHTVLLTGSQGERVNVTVTGVTDPSTGSDQCSQARSVGINVTMANVGQLLYNATVGNTNTELLDNTGTPTDSPLDLPNSDANWRADLSPGGSGNYVVQYCVPVDAKPAQMQIGLDENATDSGVWLIGSQRSAMGLS